MVDQAQQVPNVPSSPNVVAPDKAKSNGRFQKGNTAAKGRGRPKGSETTFGVEFHNRLVRGITKAGLKKAQKAGINGPIDGLEFYITELAASNLGAAASLLTKLISLDSPQAESANQPTTINILPVASGQHYLPGGKILAPSEEADRVWAAFRGGPEQWQAYLVANTLTWSADAHAHLSEQEAPTLRVQDNDNVVPLQLEPPIGPSPDLAAQMEAKLLAMSHDQLLELARALNVGR